MVRFWGERRERGDSDEHKATMGRSRGEKRDRERREKVSCRGEYGKMGEKRKRERE